MEKLETAVTSFLRKICSEVTMPNFETSSSYLESGATFHSLRSCKRTRIARSQFAPLSINFSIIFQDFTNAKKRYRLIRIVHVMVGPDDTTNASIFVRTRQPNFRFDILFLNSNFPQFNDYFYGYFCKYSCNNEIKNKLILYFSCIYHRMELILVMYFLRYFLSFRNFQYLQYL